MPFRPGDIVTTPSGSGLYEVISLEDYPLLTDRYATILDLYPDSVFCINSMTGEPTWDNEDYWTIVKPKREVLFTVNM